MNESMSEYEYVLKNSVILEDVTGAHFYAVGRDSAGTATILYTTTNGSWVETPDVFNTNFLRPVAPKKIADLHLLHPYPADAKRKEQDKGMEDGYYIIKHGLYRVKDGRTHVWSQKGEVWCATHGLKKVELPRRADFYDMIGWGVPPTKWDLTLLPEDFIPSDVVIIDGDGDEWMQAGNGWWDSTADDIARRTGEILEEFKIKAFKERTLETIKEYND